MVRQIPATVVVALCSVLAVAEPAPAPAPAPAFKDEAKITQASITIGGVKLAYMAEAGVLVVPMKDPLDEDPQPAKDDHAPPPQPAVASMSYVAYFRGTKEDSSRPITFVFNGGPGTSTIWLHMGAFGPRRVLTANDSHTRSAPYRIIDNEHTLLDASDLVFIDAPGTGFGHVQGADKEKAFYGVDQDAHAFANFIVGFLSRHGRWNSPKYLFGESYGTTRAATLALILQEEKSIDLNGVMLLGQILNWDNNADSPQFNPGMDLPYALALPSFAASAWYHRRLPNAPAALEPLLKDVESFALGDYNQALLAGSTLSAERRTAIAAKLHEYTGLPQETIERADLRINVGVFAKNLMGSDVTVGRNDARFAGPTIDPLSREPDYDPQSSALASAYVAAFNDYVRGSLKFGESQTYKPSIDVEKGWDFQHQHPGEHSKNSGVVNVMTDLAVVMKRNPNLKIQLHNGYFDLATPYFSAVYELRHLPIQPSLQQNIEMHFYESGHMIYAHEADLKALHANAAAFISRTR